MFGDNGLFCDDCRQRGGSKQMEGVCEGEWEGGQWAITAQLSLSEAQSQKVESTKFAFIAPGGIKKIM